MILLSYSLVMWWVETEAEGNGNESQDYAEIKCSEWFKRKMD